MKLLWPLVAVLVVVHCDRWECRKRANRTEEDKERLKLPPRQNITPCNFAAACLYDEFQGGDCRLRNREPFFVFTPLGFACRGQLAMSVFGHMEAGGDEYSVGRAYRYYWYNACRTKTGWFQYYVLTWKGQIELKFGYLLGYGSATIEKIVRSVASFVLPPLVPLLGLLNIAVLRRMMRFGTSSIILHVGLVTLDAFMFFVGLFYNLELDYLLWYISPIVSGEKWNFGRGFGLRVPPPSELFQTFWYDWGFMSTMLLSLALLLDRIMALKAPMKYKTMGTKRSGAMAVAALLLFAALLCLPSFVLVQAHFLAYQAQDHKFIQSTVLPMIGPWLFVCRVAHAVLMASLYVAQIIAAAAFLRIFAAFMGKRQAKNDEEEAAQREQVAQKCQLVMGTTVIGILITLPNVFCVLFVAVAFPPGFDQEEADWSWVSGWYEAFKASRSLQTLLLGLGSSISVLLHIALTKSYRSSARGVLGEVSSAWLGRARRLRGSEVSTITASTTGVSVAWTDDKDTKALKK